jgi:hypothetical protein
MASPYALDFSPVANALDGNRKYGLQLQDQELDRQRLAISQASAGREAAMHPLRLKGAQADLAAKQQEAEQRKLGLIDDFLHAQSPNYEKLAPEVKAQHWDRVKKSSLFDADDRKRMFEDPVYGPLWNDPETGYRMLKGLTREHQLKRRAAEAQIANAEGAPNSGTANIARLQNELHLDLARAKSQMEVEEILQKARALGIDIGGAPSRAPTSPAAAAPPAARPRIMETDPRFSATSPSDVAPAAPTQTQGRVPAAARPGATPAPVDPYLQLTRPPISPEQDEAERKRRAGISVLTGDIKGAGKIMSKDEDPKEYQTKDATFAERMARSEITLRGVLGKDNEKYNPADWIRSKMPDWNLTNSAEWRNYQGAAREWIAAMLRKDTGAAVTETEWNLYFPTYFPQAGDGPNEQKLKMDRRVQAARGLRGSAGPAFDRMFPNFDAEMRARLQDQDPATYGDVKTNTDRLPPGNYVYNPSTGRVEPAR